MTLASTYAHHHASGRRLGQSVFKYQRGELLQSAIGQGKKILDIGCRDGELTSMYAAGNHITGVDIDAGALDAARDRLGIQTLSFDLTEEWPLPYRQFDVVVAGEVLEHLYFPAQIVGRVAHVLRDDGVFVGSVPNAFSLKNRIRLFFGNKRNTPLADPTHINHFSRSELLAMLAKQFEQVEIRPLGRFTWLDHLFPGMFSFMLFFTARGVRRDS